MSSSAEPTQVVLKSGDLLQSRAQTLVNTVNCVGVMGKGIALAFKQRYPEMFRDYVQRCGRGEVRLGRPYVFRSNDHLIVNFPTKQHWRSVSRLEDIVTGLEYLRANYRDWGITSIAVPPLGCGNGQLEWETVGPTLYRHLTPFGIPVEIYVPEGHPLDLDQLVAQSSDSRYATGSPSPVEPEWVAVIAALDRLERQPYHWPVGRMMFQKLVYFATQAGVPTQLEYEAQSYGPYADGIKRKVAQLQTHRLLVEEQRGKMFEVRVGPSYRDAVARFKERMEPWRSAVERTVDLMSRMDSKTAEIAASAHFVTVGLTRRFGRRPTMREVVDAVVKWKIRRKPPLSHVSIVEAVVVLALRGWVDVELDEEFEPLVEELVTV